MDTQDSQAPLATEPFSVTIMGDEMVLSGTGVACSMTPDAARESAWLMIEAANSMQKL